MGCVRPESDLQELCFVTADPLHCNGAVASCGGGRRTVVAVDHAGGVAVHEERFTLVEHLGEQCDVLRVEPSKWFAEIQL